MKLTSGMQVAFATAAAILLFVLILAGGVIAPSYGRGVVQLLGFVAASAFVIGVSSFLSRQDSRSASSAGGTRSSTAIRRTSLVYSAVLIGLAVAVALVVNGFEVRFWLLPYREADLVVIALVFAAVWIAAQALRLPARPGPSRGSNQHK